MPTPAQARQNIASAKRTLALWLALVAGACSTADRPVAPPANPGVLASVDIKAAEVTKTVEDGAAAQAAKDSKAAASVEVIERSNEAAPASPQKPVIAAEVGLLRRILSVTPRPEDRAAAAEREQLVLTGRLEEANKQYASASQRADALNAQIATANTQRDLALSQLAAAIAGAKTALAAQQTQHEADMRARDAAHAKALDELRDGIRKDQVALWNRIGIGCEGAAILCIAVGFAFGGLAALRRLGPVALFLGAVGFTAFAVARVLGSPWFTPVCLGAGLIVFTWAGVFLYRHYRQGDLKTEIEARAAKLKSVLGDVVGGVEDVRSFVKQAGTATREQVDEILKQWVTEADGTAAAVDEVRRETGIVS